MKNYFANLVLLTRPYSWIDIIITGFFARFLVHGSLIELNPKDVFMIISVLLLWFSLTLFLETKHKHKFRVKVSYVLPLIIFLLALLIGIKYNFLTLIPIIFFLFLTYLYVLKEDVTWLGKISFITRGGVQASILLFILLFYGNFNVITTNLYAILGFFLMLSVRSLIGDVRDYEFDKNTFVVKFRKNISYLVAILGLIIASLFFYLNMKLILPLVPLFIMVLLLIFYDNGYNLHRLMVLTTSFTMLNIMFLDKPFLLFFLILLFMAVVFNILTYNEVPRPSNNIQKIKTKIGLIFKR